MGIPVVSVPGTTENSSKGHLELEQAQIHKQVSSRIKYPIKIRQNDKPLFPPS